LSLQAINPNMKGVTCDIRYSMTGHRGGGCRDSRRFKSMMTFSI
jgi:hypothetical protein